MMKKILILFVCLLTTTNVLAAKFSTKAKSAYLIDYDTGMEIYAKNADNLMPPSSMIKLVTLGVLFDEIKNGNIKLEDKITASENVNYKDPLWYSASKMCLIPGQQVSVRDAILAIIVLSAGDASVAVAEKISGNESQFTEKMTEYARKIGMEKSTFGNASGLPDPNNLSTTKELAILAQHIIHEYPDLYPMFATRRFEFTDTKTQWCKDWAKTHTTNYNKLLFSMSGADGMKTGHTDEGGFGMVASAKVGGRRLIGVINGLKSGNHEALAEEMKKLLTYGYKNTHTKTFFKSGDKLLQIPVWYGADKTVTATTEENVTITLDKEESFDGIRIVTRYMEPVAAPVKQGQVLGEIIIENRGKEIKRIPLIAKEKVRKVQFFGRVIKNLSVMFLGK